MQNYLDRWFESAISALPNLLSAVVIFLGSLYLAGLLSGLLKKMLEKRHAAPGVTNLLDQTTRWTVIVIGTITALQRFFDVTAFLAGLGVIGFAVGFALQDILKNFAAGIILLLQEPFKVGDAISVSGFDGAIRAIDLRTVEMTTWDGRTVIIPNADVLSNAIINYSRANRRRVDLSLGVSNVADPELTRKVALQAIEVVTGFVNEPAPAIYFHTLSGAALDLTAYFWVDTTRTNLMLAKDDALTGIKANFEQHGIHISLPTSSLYLHSDN